MLPSDESACQQHQGAAQQRQGRVQRGTGGGLQLAGIDDAKRPCDGADENCDKPDQHPGSADTSGRKSRATLTAPTASPDQVMPRGRGPNFRTGSRRATIAGSMAITNAATPEGTFSSAQCSSP